MKWWHFHTALLSALLFTLLLPLACLVLATVGGLSLLLTATRPIFSITMFARKNRPERLQFKTPSSLSKAKPYVSGYGRSTATSNGRS